MARAAQRVYLEDPEQGEAASPLLRQRRRGEGRAVLRSLVTTVALLAFIAALVCVAHSDFAARSAIRRHELERELAQLHHDCARLQLKLEALTSDGAVTARVKAQGYDYPDPAHSHTERVAELPWEAETKAAKSPAERPSVIASLRDLLNGTAWRPAQGQEASAAMNLP